MTFKKIGYSLLATASLFAVTTMFAPQEASARSSKERASCTVTIDTVNVAVIGGGSGGEGKLTCRGKTHRFSIGGGGIGSIGVSEMHAVGSVYRLTNAQDFEGVYGQVRAGGTMGSRGGEALMLQNEHGVVMRLKARSRGLSLTLGGDAMIVKYK